MKKKITILLLVAIMLFSVTACAPTTPSPEGPTDSSPPVETEPGDTTPPEGKFKVGVLIYDFANDYMSYVRHGMKQRADELDFEIEIVDGRGDQSTQIDQLETLISKKVDLIMCAVMETEANQTVVDKCKEAGIPLILNNKKPTEDVILSYDQAYYVGVATKQPGVAQAEMIVEDWKNNPEMDKNGDGVLQYVFLLGQKGHVNAEDRYAGMIEVFDKHDFKREELDFQEANWNTAEAKDITDAWLMKHNDNIEVIISNNDAMALGAIEACKAVGYFGSDASLKMPIYGVNALEVALQALRDGTLSGTVLTDMILEGRTCSQLAYNILTGADPFNEIPFESEEARSVLVYGSPVRLGNIEDAEAMYAAFD